MSDRLPCQVCGRLLATTANGLTKPHKRRRGAEDACQGTGYRQARWPVGQFLRHHAGDLWEVVADVGGQWNDYRLVCLAGREEGRELRAHGEYMHRHGWTPVAAPPSSNGPSDDPARETAPLHGIGQP
jgi:hypothetical protein